MLEVHTGDVDERRAPKGADSAAPAGMGAWKSITNLALVVAALGGLGLGLILAFTRPAGERLQGPLGLLFIVLVATTAMLGLVTTVSHKRF